MVRLRRVWFESLAGAFPPTCVLPPRHTIESSL